MRTPPNSHSRTSSSFRCNGEPPSADWSDRDLILALQTTRDARALEVLYERYWRRLQYCARAVLNDPQEAEDLVQETFLTLWKHSEGMDGERNPGALLRLTVKRRAVDLVRRRNLCELSGLDFQRWLGVTPADSMSPLEKAEFWAWVRSRLTAGQYRIVVWKYHEGLANGESASREGVATGTVKSQLDDAKKRLRAAREKI